MRRPALIFVALDTSHGARAWPATSIRCMIC